VVIEPAPDKLATIYTQLTRTDPKLLDIAGSTAGTSHSATVGGAITGGDAFPTPAGTRTAVSWGSPETSTGDYAMTAQYSFPVNWAGPTMTTGTLRGLQWTVDNNGTVNGYRSHGTRTGMSLADSATVTNADITLGPLQTDMVSVVITPPANHQTAERDVILTFADRTFFPLSADALGDTPFTVPVPTGIGASAIIQVTATNSDAGTYSIARSPDCSREPAMLPLSLPAPAVATSPADGATGVDTATDFVWTPLANGIHVLFLSGFRRTTRGTPS
jgi:hypothetical protein